MAQRGANRTRLLLIILLVTSLFLITLDLRGVNIITSIRNSSQSFLAPLQRAGSNVLSPIGRLISDISSIGETRSKIDQLEKENQKLRSELILNADTQAELQQLKGVLNLAGTARFKVVAARVISKGNTATFGETLVIDQGTKAGINRDMTVISGAGLVGVIKSATADSAVVLLLSDPSFRMGVRVAGTQEMGILSGQGSDSYSLQMLSATGNIKNGDVLVARGSSGDKPFVPGVPVGTVSHVDNSTGQLTKQGKVTGFVDLNSVGVVGIVLDRSPNDPGDSLVPKAPAPTPTVTIYVTPSPSTKG